MKHSENVYNGNIICPTNSCPSHPLVLEHHPDAFSDLSGEYLLGLPMITPIFSSNGVSGKR